MGEPLNLLSRQEAYRKDRLRRTGCATGGLKRLGSLADGEARMGQKGASGAGQLNAARASGKQRRADFDLQITQLTA